MPVYEEKKQVDGQKRYYIRTYVNDQFGNVKQITKHNKTWIGRDGKKQAEWEESNLRNNIYTGYENITLNELFKMYLKDIEPRLKKASLNKAINNYNLYIRNNLGKKKVFLISNKDIMKFHEFLDNNKIEIKNKRSKKDIGFYNMSTKYKQSIHMTLVAILNFACKYLELPKNVASIVGNFQNQKGSIKNEINFLTEDEFQKFIKYEKNSIYKDFFQVLFYTGMRRGELLALTRNDIDFEKNEISISKSINPRNGSEPTVPKTNNSNRKIKMLNIVKNILYEYEQIPFDEYIFGLKNIKLTTLQRRCDNNCRLANLNKNIRIHDFRHSFASLCIKKGVPIEIISNYLGHESITTTLNIYAHLYPNSQQELLNKLN